MENLIIILGDLCDEYENLLGLSTQKTPVIVSGKLDELSKITDEEQIVVAKINHLDAKREEVTKDIANVLNKDVKSLKLVDIINLMSQRPIEQKQLATAHDKLKEVVGQMTRVNEQNRELLQQSLELVEFDMNLLQSMKAAPQTANYNRGAYSTGNTMGVNYRGFDAKQ
jgi:flagellar biosynthesis/type III secretory pathway chaperone